MSQTKEGAQKALKKIYATYGEDYFVKMGVLGGKAGHTGGFYTLQQTDPLRHKQLSSKGGKLGKRGKVWQPISREDAKQAAQKMDNLLLDSIKLRTPSILETPKSRIPLLRRLFRKKVA